MSEIQEISSGELTAWRLHPTTQAFFRFMRDYRTQLAENIAMVIALGNPIDKEHSDKVALTCGIYRDLEEIQIEDFKNFYQPEKEGTNDTKPNEDNRD